MSVECDFEAMASSETLSHPAKNLAEGNKIGWRAATSAKQHLTLSFFSPVRLHSLRIVNAATGLVVVYATSSDTERAIDEEVKALVLKAYKVCKDTLTKNRALLDELTEAPFERESA